MATGFVVSLQNTSKPLLSIKSPLGGANHFSSEEITACMQ
jgi:hypothetical protein